MGEPTFDDRFLVLAPTGRDGALTCALLERAALWAVACASVNAMCTEAERGVAALVLTDEALTPAGVQLLAGMVARQEAWSDLPILLFTGDRATVMARSPTMQLLSPLGNVTLFDRPIRPITMVSAARSVLRARRRQYAARDALARERAAVRQRDEFLAMLGHEIRNPLSGITLAAELLCRQQIGEPYAGRIRRQARHLARLVDDLLDVSRVSSGKLELRRGLVPLDELVLRCVESARAVADARRMTLTVEVLPLVIDGDPVRLEQVFGNLITNALKYTGEGGHVHVRMQLEDSGVAVSVRDDGAGLEPEMLRRVFEPFVQGRHTLDRSDGGLGIGLTLVEALVELHGGTVDAVSPGIGAGSEFTVHLPREVDAATLADEPSATGEVLRPLRVVVIEDNDDNRELLRLLIEGLGHAVEVAGDGPSGVSTVLTVAPDVALVDIGLPGLDGYGVARAVRARGSRSMLIAITGYGQPEDRERALAAGFDDHFTKPVDPRQIESLLRRRTAA
ncbi:MAG: ATP-binding protein [Myxococcota bacterium]